MGVRTRGLDIVINAKRQVADATARAEAKGVVERWNEQLAASRDMLWSDDPGRADRGDALARRVLPRRPRETPLAMRSMFSQSPEQAVPNSHPGWQAAPSAWDWRGPQSTITEHPHIAPSEDWTPNRPHVQLRSCLRSGRERMRLPVAMWMALRTAGATSGTTSSPMPEIHRFVFM
jgi:hypothetical protein